jgi:hypothetical protein
MPPSENIFSGQQKKLALLSRSAYYMGMLCSHSCRLRIIESTAQTSNNEGAVFFVCAESGCLSAVFLFLSALNDSSSAAIALRTARSSWKWLKAQ